MDEIMQLAKQVAVLEERSISQEKAFTKLEASMEEYFGKFEVLIKSQGEKLQKFDLKLWLIIFTMAAAGGGTSSVLIKLLGP